MQLKKYYQPRKSHRTVSVNLEGNKVPLYGAGSSLLVSSNDGVVPLKLQFQIKSRGDVVGKLVRVKHRRQISCPLVINSISTKPIKFKKNSCTFEWWSIHLLHLILKASSVTFESDQSQVLLFELLSLCDLCLQWRRNLYHEKSVQVFICGLLLWVVRIVQINVYIFLS